jgi:hypothetical protein
LAGVTPPVGVPPVGVHVPPVAPVLRSKYFAVPRVVQLSGRGEKSEPLPVAQPELFHVVRWASELQSTPLAEPHEHPAQLRVSVMSE